MSKKVFRVHTFESVYVGPTEPNATFPPTEALTGGGRSQAADWSLVELPSGDVLVTHTNLRARSLKVPDPKVPGAEVELPTPHGQVWTTRIPAANIKDVQYEHEAVPAPKAIKGAA